jgi:putative glutamine amidotransferase
VSLRPPTIYVLPRMTHRLSVPNTDRPIVAVTASVRVDDGIGRLRLMTAYLDSLERASVIPIVMPPFGGGPAETSALVERILDLVAGLVLTGGEDVEPVRYGAVPSPHLGRTSAARDAVEIAAVLGARDRLLPTLAICRGAQVLNVALGGTLVQDIPSERSGALAHDPKAARDARTHAVRLIDGSRAALALGAATALVNSKHHQAIDQLGHGLVITGTAPDGIIECVETPEEDPWWMLGVQWHPEEFVQDRGAADHGLFAALAAAIDAQARRRSRDVVARRYVSPPLTES